MKAKFYLHLTEECERTAATADLPEGRPGCWPLLLCGADWRWLSARRTKQDQIPDGTSSPS